MQSNEIDQHDFKYLVYPVFLLKNINIIQL
jgi:hypothetical protein